MNISPRITGKNYGNNNRITTVVLLCIALAVITSAIYLQVGNHRFLNIDDDEYVTENIHVTAGITGKSIIWAFTSVEASNWHPVTWLSHMADVQMFGMNPRGHHLTNVVVHTISTVVLFLLLLRLTGKIRPGFFVAALFALHPLHVESVAWVAERKDVLSALFCFLTLLCYTEYVAQQKRSLYTLTIFIFILGLMSKPMLVTLPVIMLLIDYWPLDRYRSGECSYGKRLLFPLLKEKIPFFVCSFFSGIITIYAQNKGGAMAGLPLVPLWFRCQNALVSYVAYIGKLLYPSRLAVYYPLPQHIPVWQVISSLAILLLLSVAVIRFRKRYPYLVLGWFWYLITLIPVIGFIQVGGQSMADRYTYIPATGLFIMAAWWIPELTGKMRYRQQILTLLAAAAVVTVSALTWRQCHVWQDNKTLYRHALRVTPRNPLINYNLGIVLQAEGDLDSAIRHYEETLRLNPGHADAHNNLGIILQGRGERDAAIRHYRESLRISPDNSHAHNNLGCVFKEQGNLDAAIGEFREVLRTKPNDLQAHNNLGTALHAKWDLEAAIGEYRQAIRINPEYRDAHFNLALALQTQGNLDGAIREYQEALRIQPDYKDAQIRLQLALSMRAKTR